MNMSSPIAEQSEKLAAQTCIGCAASFPEKKSGCACQNLPQGYCTDKQSGQWGYRYADGSFFAGQKMEIDQGQFKKEGKIIPVEFGNLEQMQALAEQDKKAQTEKFAPKAAKNKQ